jgi:LAO/AO transport system kinase
VELVTTALTGNRRAIAQLITLVENDRDGARSAIAQLYPYTGRAYVIGVTGSPGAGKSTLVNQLARSYRAAERQVGVVAVDATSPFSGGAILGDRIRMRDVVNDPHVFVRSMATRGNLGGLARTTGDVVKVLDATGFDPIIVETVGTGQVEVEIAQLAHTVVVVEAPGMGDDIQAIKAGIMEIADVLVVNKADCTGAERTAAALEMMLDLGRTHTPRRVELTSDFGRAVTDAGAEPAGAPEDTTTVQVAGRWRPSVVKTCALQGEGILELVQAITNHQKHLETTRELYRRNRTRLVNELEHIVQGSLMERLLNQIDPTRLSDMVARVVGRELDPHAAARQLIACLTEYLGGARL